MDHKYRRVTRWCCTLKHIRGLNERPVIHRTDNTTYQLPLNVPVLVIRMFTIEIESILTSF